MTVAESVQLAILAASVSLGYVVFGVLLLRRDDAIGADSLAAFSILWGGSFLVQSAIIYVFASYGITDGSQLIGLQSSVSTPT